MTVLFKKIKNLEAQIDSNLDMVVKGGLKFLMPYLIRITIIVISSAWIALPIQLSQDLIK